MSGFIASTKTNGPRRRGLSLLELLAVVVVLATIALLVVPRAGVNIDTAKQKANAMNIAVINSTVERYYLVNNTFPTTVDDLHDPDFFPDGAPVNPVTGAKYVLNPTTHRVQTGGGGGK